MSLELSGKTAIVTGAGGGIGQAIALALASEGARVVVNDLRLEAAEATLEKIRAAGGEGLAVDGDVSKGTDVQRLVEAAMDRFSRLDILINNAGISPKTPSGDRVPVLEMDEEQWDRVMAVNLRGPFNTCRLAAPYMIQNGWGRIVNITSIMGKIGAPGPFGARYGLTTPSGAHYCAAKAGLINLTFSLARELAPHGITVNAVAPGRIETPMAAETSAEMNERMKSEIPLGEFGRPEDVAAAVMFLVLKSGRHITGEVIDVNGGWWMD